RENRHESHPDRKTPPDLRPPRRSHHVLRTRLEPEPPAQSALASACALPFRHSALPLRRSGRNRHLAPLAPLTGAHSGLYQRRATLALLLDPILLCAISSHSCFVLGRNPRPRAPH